MNKPEYECKHKQIAELLLFQRLPINTSVLVALMFAWLKMSEICTNPFDGGDKYYDIDLVEELDIEIWKASVALQESAEDE